MSTIVTRLGKGSPLSTAEMDANFTNLNTDKAELNSPAFIGTPTAPTAAANDNSTNIATTAFVIGQASTTLPIIAGTAAVGTSLHWARADHIHPSDSSRAPINSPTFTGTVTIPGGSTITGYAPSASPVFTGSVTVDGSANDLHFAGATTGNDVTIIADGTDTNIGINLITQGSGIVKLNGNALVSSVAGRYGAITLSKSDVSLANVDNTSDANKPISTATQTALDLKAPLANPTFTGTVSGVTKAMVSLGNVDNTSDANKPVSTATQTALNAKADATSPTINTGATLSISSGSIFTVSLGGTTTDAGLQYNLKGAGNFYIFNQGGTKPLAGMIANGSTSVNYLTIQPAPSGSGATLSVASYGSVDSNIDINLSPLGSGAVQLSDKTMRRVMFKDYGIVFYDSGSTSALDYTNGSGQRWAPTGTVTLSITNWPPTGNLGELLIKGINLGAATITWPTVNWIKSDGTTTTTFSSNGVTLQTSGTDWVILWTHDAGTTIYGKIIR
jgi:hypothetical protein